MTLIGQLLLRNLGSLSKESNVLWINAVPDGSWQQIQHAVGSMKLFCQDYAHYNYLSESSAPAAFGTFPATGDSYGHIILTLPHSKARQKMMFECATGLLSENGKLWLVGENKGGVKSGGKLLGDYYDQVIKLDSARHCSLFEARNPVRNHSFNQTDLLSNCPVEVLGKTLEICSLPGVFAHGRTDPGTLMLLDVLPELTPFGSVLDFGCGSGVISAAIASIDATASLTMTDVDSLAIHSARQTMLKNGHGGRVIPNDGLMGLGQKYDLIVSNPPFHQGSKTDTRLSMKLLGSIRNFLRPYGSVVMVVNRHIPYGRWLDEQFGNHHVLKEDAVYRVLKATNTVRN